MSDVTLVALILAWLALVNTRGGGESPRDEAVDFLGDEESNNISFFGEDMVRSVEPSEEGVSEAVLVLPLMSSHSPSLESLLWPVNGIDLIWLALCNYNCLC